MKPLTRRNLRNGLLFVSPWLVGFAVFVLVPASMSFYYSLCDYSVLTPPVFIGPGNYTDMVADDSFWHSLGNTAVFGLMALPLTTLLSIALALLLNSRMIGRSFFRTVFFIPSLVPLVAMGLLWNWMLNGEYGILNHLLEKFFHFVGLDELGLRYGPNWLTSTRWSKPALVLTAMWGVGHSVVIYLAGLQDISRTYYEAAYVDGASWWQQTVNITIPLLSPVIYFNLLMACIGILQVFAVPYVMMGPQGDPLRSSMFYLMYLFDQAFRKLNMGYACAMAWLLFVLIAGLTYTAHKITIRHVHYDET